MEKILFVLVLCAVVKASPRHHTKFHRTSEEYEVQYKKVACTSENDRLRSSIIDKAQCGEPKEEFVYLDRIASYEAVSPSAVWVKRCAGLCDYSSPDSRCVATEAIVKHIPVRVLNVKTNKETCATYPVEEHVSCGCCSRSAEDCAAPKVYVPRKCACQCPNTAERRSCLSKRNDMRWNRNKCVCEQRRRRQQ